MKLRTLGGLALPEVGCRRHKPLLLLTYLALEGPKERRYLAELLWPAAANPRQSLSVALSQLKEHAPSAIETDGVRLWATVECDALQLAEAAASHEWHSVVDLYRGPFLSGVDINDGNVEIEEWIFYMRENLALQAQRGLVTVAELSLAAGDARTTARLAEGATALQADVATVDEELLTRLHSLLVSVQSPRAAALRREAAEVGVSIAVTAGATRVPGNPRAAQLNLPHLATPLVGREDELRRLEELLEGGERLVNITGLGGIGKTRLGLALAQRLQEGAVFD